MSVTPVEYKHKRSGTRFNPDKNCFIGWRIDVRINGKRYRNKRFETKKQAETFIDTLKLEHKYKRAGLSNSFQLAPRISEVFQKRLDRAKTRRDFQRCERVFKYFLDVVGFDLRITETRTAHFQKFINARTADGVSPATVHRELVPISAAFRTASEVFPDLLDGYEPPAVKRPKCPKKARQTVITESEKNAIVGYLMREKTDKETLFRYKARRRVGRMFEIAWFLGLRLGEVLKLEKTDFNFNERKLRVVRWKTNNVSLMEFLPEFICDLIQTAIDENESKFIYSKNGNPPTAFYSLIKEAVTSAGLRYGTKYPDGITFHTNRHSFTSRLIQVTDLATAASFTGHSNKEMVLYYSHSSSASRQTAMRKLYGKKQMTDEDLMEIFVKVREGQMPFADFKRSVLPDS